MISPSTQGLTVSDVNDGVLPIAGVQRGPLSDNKGDDNTISNHSVAHAILPKKVSPTPKNAGKNEPEQSHHHSNQTLQHLMKNMTILKVNKSELRDIVDSMNKSRSNVINPVKLANPHPFNIIIKADHVCDNRDIFLVSYIHTSPDHYKRRMVIRQTWGNQKYYPDINIRVVFIMGMKPQNPEVQKALLFESEQYGDIIQEDFMDTYRNLTYKGVAGLKWVTQHCSHAKYVLKSDDDIFVNMFTLLRHLKSFYNMNINRNGLLMCLVWSRMKVMREGKWKVDKSDFAEDYYPTYCSGSAFTMSTDVAIGMHNVSYHVPFFWVDDFYITGLLTMKLQVKHKQFMSTYVLDGRKLEEKFTGPQWFTYIFSHIHDLNKIQSVWERVVQLAKGVKKPEVKYARPDEVAGYIAKYDEAIKAKEAQKKADDDKKKKKQ